MSHCDGDANTWGLHTRSRAARYRSARADIDDDATGIFVANNRPVRAETKDTVQAITATPFWLIAAAKRG